MNLAVRCEENATADVLIMGLRCIYLWA